MVTLAPVIPIPSQPRPDTDPQTLRVAEAMLAAGMTPARLARCPLLSASFAGPLAELTAARGPS